MLPSKILLTREPLARATGTMVGGAAVVVVAAGSDRPAGTTTVALWFFGCCCQPEPQYSLRSSDTSADRTDRDGSAVVSVDDDDVAVAVIGMAATGLVVLRLDMLSIPVTRSTTVRDMVVVG